MPTGDFVVGIILEPGSRTGDKAGVDGCGRVATLSQNPYRRWRVRVSIIRPDIEQLSRVRSSGERMFGAAKPGVFEFALGTGDNEDAGKASVPAVIRVVLIFLAI